MPADPELLVHRQWLGTLQPVGLVVSPPALVQAGAVLETLRPEAQARFVEHLHDDGKLKNLSALLTDPGLFNWRAADLVADSGLEAVLPAYHETLTPTFAVKDRDAWLLLIEEVTGDLDAVMTDHAWHASPQTRFERLLRETGVPIGLLCNGTDLRLVYFPKGESPGHVTFPCSEMAKTAGRPVLAAVLMLLGDARLFTLPEKQRLPALLQESRKYQNTVSTELAEQVLAALFDLLRGFQAADDASRGELLKRVLADDPDQVYAGLVTVLMRLVFLLYAEDRGLMSTDEVYVKHYSVAGLFARLEDDAGHHPDTMDHRYGAWGQLVALWRLVHDGGGHGKLQLPARHGYLFDPDRYPFLEGRTGPRATDEVITTPLVADGTIYRVLRFLLVLDGERLSYRTLDVEQIGSVYEAIMGYRLEKAAGRSIALKSKKKSGAPVTINLEELLKAKERAKWLKEHADQTIDGKALTALKSASTVDDLTAALEKRIAKAVTPNIVPAGAMILQPNDERRKSGAHYTPRALTQPIVAKALEPLLNPRSHAPRGNVSSAAPQPRAAEGSGERVLSQRASAAEGRGAAEERSHAERGNEISLDTDAILALKICDPAMGSGAFLVEACRQLGEALVAAWTATGTMPKVPDDETPELLAMRTVAQRCLYGVDRNPMAVDLAKLSLWLATLAKDHPFTFLDHALRHGDSLVGLGYQQIRDFRWSAESTEAISFTEIISEKVSLALDARRAIHEADEYTADALKRQKHALAEEALSTVRFIGNLVCAAYFNADKDKARQKLRLEYLTLVSEYLRTGNMALRPTKQEASLRTGDKPVEPFHWEIEFPEVFRRSTPITGKLFAKAGPRGFDCIVGNPPFAGKNTIADGNRENYPDWLKQLHEESHGNADLVAHFFRRAFNLLKPGGTLGLIATNTIAQGDTRSSGLRWICKHDGTIYNARRRYKWPGLAAVVVSVVHIIKDDSFAGSSILDGKPFDRITAYLFHAGGHDDPKRLRANELKVFKGVDIGGMGFTFDDERNQEVATPTSVMRSIIESNENAADLITPFFSGEEINDATVIRPRRWVINFGNMSLEQASQYPELLSIVRNNVKPERDQNNREIYRRLWWQFAEKRSGLSEAMARVDSVCVITLHQPHWVVNVATSKAVYSHALAVITGNCMPMFAALQSSPKEIWVRLLASSMKDDLRYTPSDCFENFPFPAGFETDAALEAIGQEYYDYRAQMMIASGEGLTKTYNRFHDPGDQSEEIQKLRQLHDRMDRAVLAAYGGDFATLTVPPCEFLLDYDDEEDDEDAKPRKRKKPWRYRWPDTFRDEVLALLLALNAERAAEERMAPPPVKAKKPRGRKATKPEPGLF